MNKFSKPLAAVALAIVTFSPAAYALSIGTPKADEFVQKASQSTLFEIESSKLALSRTQNTNVKTFAEKMIAEHTSANAALQTAAGTAGLSASVAATLDEKHQKKLEELQKEDAEDFDDEYVDMQESAHRKAVKLFASYAEDGDNATLKNFAAQTLPTLENHKTEVNVLEDQVDEVD